MANETNENEPKPKFNPPILGDFVSVPGKKVWVTCESCIHYHRDRHGKDREKDSDWCHCNYFEFDFHHLLVRKEAVACKAYERRALRKYVRKADREMKRDEQGQVDLTNFKPDMPEYPE